METFWQDIRYGARMLIKRPGFTVVAVLTLALGIGANTAIFSIVNAVLLSRLPYKDADRLVVMWRINHETGNTFPLSPAQFFYFTENSRLIEGTASVSNIDWSGNLTDMGEPERVQGILVSANFFSLIGVPPEHGRVFSDEDEKPGQNQVVMISHGLWQRRFGSDEGVIGRKLTLNGETYSIVGILPRNFQFAPGTDFWAPLAFDAKGRADDDNNYLSPVMARLKPGVTIEQVQTEMDTLATQFPSNSKYVPSLQVISAKESLVQNIRPMLLVLLGAVGFILFMGCANVANLMLVRAATRQHEIAIRLALGAGRRRLIRQLLTESFLLSVVGGVLGLLFALWGMEILASGLPENLAAVNPRVKAPGIDITILLFTIGLSLLTSFLFGLAPALQASNVNLQDTLKEESKGTGHGSQGRRLRQLLVVAEIALAMVLLVGSALMLNSFWRLLRVSPGFNPENVVTVDVSLPESGYHEPKLKSLFFQQVLERVGHMPGVSAAGAINYLPLSGSGLTNPIIVEGRPPQPAGQDYVSDVRVVTPDYFRTMQIPLLQGRAFDEQDKAGAVPSAVVSADMARRLWPTETPLGKRVRMGNAGPDSPWLVVVGVVGDTKPYSLDMETPMQLYQPFEQNPWGAMSLVMRTTGSTANVVAALRKEIWAVDKNQPVFNIRTVEQVLEASVTQQKFATTLLAIFGTLALVLASIGIYGVMSYVVTQRTYEIGLRMALGAQQSDVLKLIIRQGMALALTGIAAGLLGAFALTHLMSNLLFEVSVTDPTTFVVISAFLSLVALVACYLPARRAARIDPTIALRYT